MDSYTERNMVSYTGDKRIWTGDNLPVVLATLTLINILEIKR